MTSEVVVRASDGVQLHVEIDEPAAKVPERPTLVLSHGYTLDRRCWIYQRRALCQAGYAVAVWDQRGHGRSATGPPAHYTIDQLGSDLAAVLHQGVPEGPVLLVGHSMGGMAIMAMAQDHPDVVQRRVAAVAFVDSSSGQMQDVDWGLGARIGSWVTSRGPVVADRLAPHQPVLQSLFSRMPWPATTAVAASSFGSKVPIDVARLTAQMMLDTDFAVMSAFAPTLTAHDKQEALATLRHLPALVLVGDRDVLTPPRHSDVLATSLPRARHVVVARAGHIMMVEHPELVTDHLLELAAGLGSKAAAAVSHQSPFLDMPGQTVPQRSVDLRPGRGRAALTVRAST